MTSDSDFTSNSASQTLPPTHAHWQPLFKLFSFLKININKASGIVRLDGKEKHSPKDEKW